MCLGIPGRVVAFADDHPDFAIVDVFGVERRVNTGILDDQALEPGDWVLIHMGFVMEIIDEAEAEQATQGLELMGRSRTEAELSSDPSG